MNAEMYSRIGGKALPEDNLNTVKVINFVDEEGQPVAFGQGAQGPAGLNAKVNNATPDTPGLVKQAAHVSSVDGTVKDLVAALVTAGIMAAD